MTKPRVLFLDHTGALGGAELYLLDLARAYRETSKVCLFESGPFRDKLGEAGIPSETLTGPSALLDVKTSSGPLSAVKAVPGLARLTLDIARRARAFDAIYANSQKSLVVGGLAGLMANRPVIWNLHDMLSADHFSWLNRQVAVTWANLLTRRVVVNSHATKRAFVECGGNIDKTEVVYNGIDPTPFDGLDASSESLRTELGLPSTPLVGIFSRLAPWKGQHVLLGALTSLPDVHALLVGDALFRGDESYEKELRQTAERLGVEKRVHFLGFRDNIPQLMALSDIVVHASTAPEPFGRVIVEGMLARRPVIAARAGGAKEIIADNETGLLTTPGDSDELASAIRKLLEDPDKADRLADAGRRHALDRFSLKGMIADLTDVIWDACR